MGLHEADTQQKCAVGVPQTSWVIYSRSQLAKPWRCSRWLIFYSRGNWDPNITVTWECPSMTFSKLYQRRFHPHLPAPAGKCTQVAPFKPTFYSRPRKTTSSIPTVILSQGSLIEQGDNGNRDTPNLLALPMVSWESSGAHIAENWNLKPLLWTPQPAGEIKAETKPSSLTLPWSCCSSLLASWSAGTSSTAESPFYPHGTDPEP